MKIKLLTSIKRNGQNYVAGDILDIPENNVGKWLKNGWGESIEKIVKKKEVKIKKETKELKIDLKETKNATNKD
ncbi:MAG: hypothetical protein CMJ25_23040 [Phycisphaerae bacterium]|nr:hypothetical protein [Phycisphaerae bacterium]|tara:strand:+ start:684 stop:905 length:222 start_codon:yes stop_codon:yes gene_type:complete